ESTRCSPHRTWSLPLETVRILPTRRPTRRQHPEKGTARRGNHGQHPKIAGRQAVIGKHGINRYSSSMKLAELIPALHELPRADKFRAVQFLTAELAQGEGGLLPGAEYPVWSPF